MEGVKFIPFWLMKTKWECLLEEVAQRQQNESSDRSVIQTLILFGFFAIVINFLKDGLTTWVPEILYDTYQLHESLSILLTLILPILTVFGTTFVVMLNKKIVWLTDLHTDCMSDGDQTEKLTAAVNRLKPDLILLGGDLMDGRPAAISGKLLPLRKLQAADGVFGVPGNHEYYSGFAEWLEFLQKECRIKMLVNDHTDFDYGLTLAGIADQAGTMRDLPQPDIKKALAECRRENFIILMSHRPAIAAESEKHGVDLQLSGHTHGGMLWGFDRLVALVNGGFASGLYRRGNLQIYVSNGTGIWGGFPLRFGHPAEITLLEFEKI